MILLESQLDIVNDVNNVKDVNYVNYVKSVKADKIIRYLSYCHNQNLRYLIEASNHFQSCS